MSKTSIWLTVQEDRLLNMLCEKDNGCTKTSILKRALKEYGDRNLNENAPGPVAPERPVYVRPEDKIFKLDLTPENKRFVVTP
jgi:hypothetical protein